MYNNYNQYKQYYTIKSTSILKIARFSKKVLLLMRAQLYVLK